jgi:hypothetical protein
MKSTGLIKGAEKCLFVLDLLLCSIWGLFMFSTWGFSIRALTVPLLLVVMRIWLLFLVYKRIGWGLYSAIAFAVLLMYYEHRDFVIALPIVRMVDYACMIFCGASPKLFYAGYYYTSDKETGQLIANIGYAWLVGYPIVVGLFSLLKLKAFKFRMMPGWKTVIKYTVCVSVYAYCYEFVREPSSPPYWWVWTLLMSLVPIIVERHCYKKDYEGFTPMWKDRQVRYYGLLSLIMLTAFLIGRENPGYLGFVGALALPVLLLYVTMRFEDMPFQSRDALILVAGSFVFWWAQFFDHELRIIALALNLCCIAYVCFLKGLNWKTLLFVPLAIAVFIQPLCIGYNLYTATHVGMRSKYRYYDRAINGLWVVDDGKDKLGIRDRYGMVINADYEEIYQLQPSKPYVKVLKNGKWGVYDLEQHRMDIAPTYTDIIQKGKYTFLLLDEENPKNNKYLTMFVHYYRYQAKFRKFYELTDTIPEEVLAYDWSEFEEYE